MELKYLSTTANMKQHLYKIHHISRDSNDLKHQSDLVDKSSSEFEESDEEIESQKPTILSKKTIDRLNDNVLNFVTKT